MATVIVFGATGAVGSVVARTAQKKGARVWLAMRDTEKPITGLSPEQEREGGYQRVQADLTQPETVAAAVKESGATRAFIYIGRGSPDHMRSTVEALKSAGIKFVVFLSSYTVLGDPRDVLPSEAIPYMHAQVEIGLEEVFGLENCVAVRPGGFAMNLPRYYKPGIIAGSVKIHGGKFRMDCITPNDMGEVTGTILVEGPRNGQKKVYLYGPQEISQKDAIGVIEKVLGKRIETEEMTDQEALDKFTKAGLPKPLREYLVRIYSEEGAVLRTNYETGVANVQLYTGRPATGLQEWVEANTELFTEP